MSFLRSGYNGTILAYGPTGSGKCTAQSLPRHPVLERSHLSSFRAYVVQDLLHVRATAGSKSPRSGRSDIAVVWLLCLRMRLGRAGAEGCGAGRVWIRRSNFRLGASAGPTARPTKCRPVCFSRRVPQSPEDLRQLQAPSCSAAFSRPGLS